jgi:hypothetical protein
MPVDIRNVSYAAAERHHYSASSDTWRNNISRKITNAANGDVWHNPNIKRRSCAIRLSIALYRAGVRFPTTRYQWTRPSGAIYPSSAGDYPTLLLGGETVEGRDSIQGRMGVIHFEMPGMDHVTLWKGGRCHFGASDCYFKQSRTVTFWQMSA